MNLTQLSQLGIYISLAIYSFGALTSQSLLSLGGTLFVIAPASYLLFQFKKNRLKVNGREKLLLSSSLLYIAFLLLNTLLRPEYGYRTGVLTFIPLYFIPLSGLIWERQSDESFLKKVKNLTYYSLSLGTLVVFIKCLYQVLALDKEATGFFGVTIFFAYACLPVFVFYFEKLLHSEKTVEKLSNAALMTMLFLMILMSANRGTLLTILIFVPIRIFFFWIHDLKKLIPILTLSITLICAFGVYYVSSPKFRGNTLTKLSKDPSVIGRLFLWKENLLIFKSNPLVGVGPKNNSISGAEAKEKDPFVRGLHRNLRYFAHSIYIQSLAENGVIGTFLFFLLFFSFLWLYPSSWPLILAILISGLTDTIFSTSRTLHAVFIQLILWPIFFQPLKNKLKYKRVKH